MDEKNINQEEVAATQANAAKEYKEERFEFALFVNNNLVCKRNFMMYNFIEGSMQTEDFNHAMSQVVRMIKDDLKSKSRIYTWYYYDEENPQEEFVNNPLQPWECVFKFVVFDNKKEVFSKVWDGSVYPAAIRNNVDIANNSVKVISKIGNVYIYDMKYYEERKDRLTPELNARFAMILEKENLLPIITKRICEMCSSWNNSSYEKIGDYTTTMTFGKGKNAKTYNLLIAQENKKYYKAWEKAVEEKTNAYFSRKNKK